MFFSVLIDQPSYKQVYSNAQQNQTDGAWALINITGVYRSWCEQQRSVDGIVDLT